MAQAVAQLMNHHLPIKLGEAFVDVVGGDVQGLGGHFGSFLFGEAAREASAKP